MMEGFEKKKAMKSALQQLMNKANTETARRMLGTEEGGVEESLQLAEYAFREAINAFKAGEMKWDEMAVDLADTLKAMNPKGEVVNEDDEDEDDDN